MGQNSSKATRQPHQEAGNVNRIKKSALVYVKNIAEGGFSTVYHMKWKCPEYSINVAVKRLNRKDEHELEVLSSLDHPNIVKLMGVVDEGMDFMLVLELCEGGSLRSYLKAQNGRRLNEQHFFQWAEQAARPLVYLRGMNWVHKDVKSPNYMVTGQHMLKLGDFGLAKNISQTVRNATETATYQWMAPELLVKGILSPKYDIFALAVVLWELWTVSFPWAGLENQVVLWKVCNENERLPIPEDCPQPIKDLLSQCWQTEWQQRPDILQVLQVITSAAKTTLQQRQLIAGPWYMVEEFGQQDGPGKLSFAIHMTMMTLSYEFREMDYIVIADLFASQIKIYNMNGGHKLSIDTCSRPITIVVSDDNTFFMTDKSRYIAMYKLDGKYKGQWGSTCPRASSPAPMLLGMAIDHVGNLLLGDTMNEFIYRHRQDGTCVASIKVDIEPWYIAVTSQGTMVIADCKWNTTPKVINNKGEVMHTLKQPDGVSRWMTNNIYCHKNIIFVVSLPESSIRCYSVSGRYIASMPLPPLAFCGGLAMTPDSQTLFIFNDESVRRYERARSCAQLPFNS